MNLKLEENTKCQAHSVIISDNEMEYLSEVHRHLPITFPPS